MVGVVEEHSTAADVRIAAAERIVGFGFRTGFRMVVAVVDSTAAVVVDTADTTFSKINSLLVSE